MWTNFPPEAVLENVGRHSMATARRQGPERQGQTDPRSTANVGAPPLRILIVDDDAAIHRDFDRILADSGEEDPAQERFFGAELARPVFPRFIVDHAYQGTQGWERAKQAVEEGRPYSVAFVDMRMPPGPDGLTTIEQIWQADADVHVVICTAYSDYSWSQMAERLQATDRWLIMKKPVDVVEVRQTVTAMSRKWTMERQQRHESSQLRRTVSQAAEVARREAIQRERAEQELREKEAQLRQQQRLEAMGAVTGGVAHEFNNLLQVIQSYVSFPLEVLPPASSVASDLQVAQRAVRRATEITSKLLNFSRRKPARKEVISLNQLVNQFVQMWRPLLGSHIEVRTALNAVPATVCADGEMLEQVLTNLCLNARDAMPDGGWIEIATRHPESQDGHSPSNVELWVTDTGSGMDEETRRQIFDPFFTTKGVGKGSGLGLAVVYGIVQEHGGEIEVHSEPGMGTAFVLRLPIAEESATRENREIPLERAEPEMVVGHGDTVLVAEDDPTVRDAIVRIFKSHDFSPLAAADGSEAWELFQQHCESIRIVLLDEVMPGKTGHEVLQLLRNRAPEMPVLLCTGYDPRATHEGVGADDPWLAIVPKPFESRDIMSAVGYYLQAPEDRIEPPSTHYSI